MKWKNKPKQNKTLLLATIKGLLRQAENCYIRKVVTDKIEIGIAGSVNKGKAISEQTETEDGYITKSENGTRWKIEVSDTGQIVTTNLGL